MVEEGTGKGGGNASGGSHGGGENSGGNHPSEIVLTAINQIMSNEFRNRILLELGVPTNLIAIGVSDSLKTTTHGIYNDRGDSIILNSKLFDYEYTLNDLEAILFHEFVHAKQDLLDGKIIERVGNTNVIFEYSYILPCDDYYIEEGRKDFNEILKFNGIPIDKNNCNAKQQILWDAYYEIYVGVREREKANNDTYTIQCNIVFIECEKEAYQLVYEKYAGRISPKYERETFEMKEYFTNLYERIINFGRKLD